MLATDPALLHAPERRASVEVDILVDPDVAGFEQICGLHGVGQVGRIDPRCQAVRA